MSTLRSGRELPRLSADLPPFLTHAWRMVEFVHDGTFVVDTPFQQLVMATVLRSTNTFEAIPPPPPRPRPE